MGSNAIGCSIVHQGCGREDGGVEAAGPTQYILARGDDQREVSAYYMAIKPTCCRMSWADSRDAFDRCGLDYPASVPNSRTSIKAARAIRLGYRCGSVDALSCCPRPRNHSALESSHAVAHAVKLAPTMREDQVMIINLSGRGDKDMHTIVGALGAKV